MQARVPSAASVEEGSSDMTADRERSTGLDQSLQFQNIFNHFPEALIITDARGHIRHINRVAKSMLNHNGEHLLLEDWPRAFGLHQPDMVTPYRVSELPVLRALQGERAQDVEMIIRHEESEAARSISMASWPIIGADGSIEGAIVIFTNPSPVKQLEESRERYIQRTEVLYRLSNIITASGSNLGKLLKSVSILVAKTLGDMASITLLNQAQEKLHIAAAYDTDSTARAMLRKVIEQAADLDRSQGLVAKAINTGQPILIPHIPIEELRAVSLPIWQEFVDYAGIESILVVPMIGRNGTVGALSVARHIGNGAFSSADQSFVSEIATRTALAVEYSRLFESLRAEVMARKSAHKALDVSEGRFRAIFEATALGIKILDLDGNILQTNAAFESMLGRAEHELVGGHFTEFVDPADRPAAREIFHEIKVNRAPFLRFEHRGIHADGSLVWMKTIFTPVKNIKTDGKNGSAVFIVGIIENITEQKKIQSELAEMSNRLQGSVELERLRLAQELHDNPMQTLYTAIYQIEELKNKSNPQMKEALENVNQDIKSVLDGLRATAKELRPPTLFSFGLEHAIRSHVDDIRDKYPNIKVLLSLAHDRQLLPEKARLALFRVAQQSLANVLRHAEATEVKVRFSFDAEEVRLEIADNGKGFEVPDNWIGLVRSGHYGLAGAAERIHALGGTLTVKSELGHSTVVIAAIPWRNLQD